MESQAYLESSLRHSALLGLEVLGRASRRCVDWTSTGASQASTMTVEGSHKPAKGVNDVFANIAELMVQTTYQCQSFYGSGCCSEPTDAERIHMRRFHTRPAAGSTKPARSAKKHMKAPDSKAPVFAAREDFYIEVSPGTYAITAATQDSQQQTRLVRVRAEESVHLTFNL